MKCQTFRKWKKKKNLAEDETQLCAYATQRYSFFGKILCEKKLNLQGVHKDDKKRLKLIFMAKLYSHYC